ncbi:MAG: tetratricopeptide repeat protein [Bacteroidales bacterium]|nr:tetratricopeptide repeat protein [Bacteroidales bacterium]
MNKDQIRQIHRQILKLTYQGKLHDAMSVIKQQNVVNTNDETSPLAIVEQTYKMMLNYTIEGMNDPNRDAIFKQMQVSLLLIADSVRNALMKKHAPSQVYSLAPLVMPTTSPCHENIAKWFDYILRTENLVQDNADVYLTFCGDEKADVSDQSLIVSALTLSCLIFFDISKYRLLVNIYLQNREQIWQRALVGIVILSYNFNKRIMLFPEAKRIMSMMTKSDKFQARYEATVIQMIRAIGTDKISKKITDEIIPQVSKIVPGIKDRMQADATVNDVLDDKNPAWKDYILENKDLVDKMTEMTKLQLEGGDVFINSFAQLKHYAFFKSIENWFLPFRADHPTVREMAESASGKDFDLMKFAKTIEKSPYICNSDKYSFCLSVALMPEDQRKTLGKYVGMEFKEMNEISKEEKLLHREEYSYKTLIQYIQDIYRFFKLNQLGKDFIDVFSKGFSPSGTMLFDMTFADGDKKRNVGEFFFSNEYYSQAYDIFEKISLESPNFEIYQKMGYAAQKSGDIKLALENYLKAQIFEDKQLWNLKKIGWCYRKLSQPAKALEYYKLAEAQDLDNLGIATSIGRCLLELENYAEALKYYYKVEYLDQKNTKVLAPIAWCNYSTGKYDQSLKYCFKLIAVDPCPEIHVLAGHNCRKLGELKDAVEHYKNSIGCKNYTLKDLEEAINADYKDDEGKDVSADNNLIIDYISYELGTI